MDRFRRVRPGLPVVSAVVIAETLPSGLRLVTESMAHVRSAAVGVWLTRGSRHESDPRSGIAHSVEDAERIRRDIGLPLIIRPSRPSALSFFTVSPVPE